MKASFCIALAIGLALTGACSDSSTPTGLVETTETGSEHDAADVAADPTVDYLSLPCGSCHGEGEPHHPPPGVDGSSERDARGVGAHEPHVVDSDWHLAIRCSHCHPVPEEVGDPGHVDEERPADVIFSGLSVSRYPAADWDGSTCAVYCHGAAFGVTQSRSTAWTSVEPLECDGCHGNPPDSPHPDAADCGRCHLDVADDSGQIAIAYFHIDSVLQAPHGAHLVHLGGAEGPDYACSDCHQGENVHAPMKDGYPLEETTICAECHDSDPVDPLTWRSYDTLWD